MNLPIPRAKGYKKKDHESLGKYNYNHHSRSIRSKIREITPDRWVELIIATGVVIFAALQYRSSQSASEQTNQLIAAAKVSAFAATQNVQASRNFAESAKGINNGVSEAIDKLNLQAGALVESAEQTSRVADETHAANQNVMTVAQSQTRPWLTISTLKLTNEKVDANATNFEKTWDFDISLANYGNSPARRIVINIEPIQETTQYVKPGDRNWKDLSNCAEIERLSLNESSQSTMVVFPQQIDIPAEPQSASIGNTINRLERTPTIVACIAYQGAGTDIHHTKILYKPIRSAESVPVPNFPNRRYLPILRYEISDTEAN